MAEFLYFYISAPTPLHGHWNICSNGSSGEGSTKQLLCGITIGNEPIYNCNTSIEESTFGGCTNLSSITLPEGLTSIEKGTFGDCTNLSSITLPEGLTSVGDYAFINCTSLKSVILPESLDSIGLYVFYGCTNLSSITLPEGLSVNGKPHVQWFTIYKSFVFP